MRELAEPCFAGGRRIIEDYRPLPQDDPKQRRPDIGLAKQVLDWAPKTVLRDGLNETIGYFGQIMG